MLNFLSRFCFHVLFIFDQNNALDSRSIKSAFNFFFNFGNLSFCSWHQQDYKIGFILSTFSWGWHTFEPVFLRTDRNYSFQAQSIFYLLSPILDKPFSFFFLKNNSKFKYLQCQKISGPIVCHSSLILCYLYRPSCQQNVHFCVYNQSKSVFFIAKILRWQCILFITSGSKVCHL